MERTTSSVVAKEWEASSVIQQRAKRLFFGPFSSTSIDEKQHVDMLYMILSNSFENTQATSASKLQYHNYPNLSADMPMLWGSHCAFDIPLPDCSLGSLFISKFKIAKTNMIICVYSFIFEYSHSYV